MEETRAALQQALTREELFVTDEKVIPYGLQLVVTDNRYKTAVNIYNGKKGIRITVGGAASPLKDRVERIANDLVCSPATDGNPAGFEGVSDFDNRWIGSDESGKGDFFGPLVIAAVMVDAATAAALTASGVRDSKLLSDEKAKVLAQRIREICHGRFALVEITPAKYNVLYQRFRAEGKNLNHLLAWAHASAIEEVLTRTPCRFALVDKFADESLIRSRLFAKGREITLVQAPRAEKNIAVAAASILARERFLYWIELFRVQYKMDFPKGASAAVTDAARAFVQRYGKNCLHDVAKLHFKTADELY
ncbi:ribonuclease HIII [Thermosinus carboxydivorans Nor1]|uniref:Ribonuclease n=1 Tax=Thermosinus carboxydivorans Nor1 TaxID=401526 RepID=A1HPY8_9FIRM|nr:ribonuclease HIII [Thermosinus carboxydivorans Nor1]